MENENILYAAHNNNIEAIKKIVTSKEIANQKSKDKCTALHLSSYQGFLEITSFLIEKGTTLDSKDNQGRTALHLAAIQNKLPIVKILVEKGCNINAQDKKKNTSLHYACLYGHLDIVKFLLSQNAKTNYQDKDGRTVLHHACENTSETSAEIIKELLTSGVSINILDQHKATPLHIASIVGNVKGVAKLLENKADTKEEDEDGSLAIHNAAFSGNVAVLELLLPYSDKENRMKDGATPMILAASVGNTDIIKKLLEMGADPTAVDSIGDNVLHKAAFFGHTETFKFLINQVSDVNSSNKKNVLSVGSKDGAGCTVIHKAAYSGHYEIVEMCVEFSKKDLIKLDMPDFEGATPLHKAANNGHIKIMELLIQQKSVDIAVTDYEGSTTLHTAAFNGQESAVALLLKHKPSLAVAKDKSGAIPIHNAACSGNEKVVSLLTENNNENIINARELRGYTPLHMAVAVGSITVIDYLIKIGAELSPKTGETPLDTAIIFRREDIALHLIEKGGKSNISAHENFVKQVVAQENKSSKKQVRQDVLNRGIVMFNQKPKKGIQFVINQKLVDDNPVSIAQFLFNTEGLNSKQVGDLLSDPDPFGTSIRKAYLGLLHMKNISIDVAIRNFLGAKFRLPGESQRIDRMMESFASYYHENNPNSIFENNEAVHLLAFAIIMLNTDLHNPAIKKKMTKIEFKGRVLGLNGGKDFPSEKLDEIYEKILNDEIKMDAEGKQFTNAEKKGWLVKQGGKIRSFKKRWFILNDNQLFYFKKATETTTPLGIIPLENLNIKKDLKEEFGFRLEANSGAIKAVRLGKDGGPRKGNHAFYLIKASDEKERDSWIEAISTNIHRNPFYELITKRKNNEVKNDK